MKYVKKFEITGYFTIYVIKEILKLVHVELINQRKETTVQGGLIELAPLLYIVKWPILLTYPVLQ